jgi:hypothetical protein
LVDFASLAKKGRIFKSRENVISIIEVLDSEHIGTSFDGHSLSFGSELADVLELYNKGLH